MAATDKLNHSEPLQPGDVSYGLRMAYEGMKSWRLADIFTVVSYTVVAAYTLAMIVNLTQVY
ncbi:hypothetical protein ACSHT0_10090 [Tepidicaulis sp. LMO-SS28]|uniref:hypothetical protein n=1 Tax=Tepidicaulis sp. LMO-SS28 TaxID=3447455 RepID=UPI003EE16423